MYFKTRSEIEIPKNVTDAQFNRLSTFFGKRWAAFVYDDASLNPSEDSEVLSVKFVFEKKENKQKEARDGQFKNNK